MSNNKNPQLFPNKETFSRMNFLFQASTLMAGRNNTLASYYGELCKKVAKRGVLRIEPDMKRTLCKRCSIVLKPGITAELSTVCAAQQKRRNTHQEACNIDDETRLQVTCSVCGYKRNFYLNSNHHFWLDKSESVAEINTLSNK